MDQTEGSRETAASEDRHLRMAVDVGGTFTDVCVLDERTGGLSVSKVPTSPDIISGVLSGANEAGVALDRTSLFIHGTTIATNALITRNYPASGMVTTAGFRDILEIRRGTRDDIWDAYKEVAPPHIRRRHRLVVPERIDSEGNVVEELDEEAAREVARTFKQRGIDNIAVCFINSFVNPVNEQRMKAIVLEEIPGARVSTSSDVLPEIFEHERFSTTVANTILAPVVGPYCRELAEQLNENGYAGELLLLHSGGGVMSPRAAERLAARLAASGIAAGAIATREIARLCGFENAIGLDMGGTSTDVSLVFEGETHTADEWFVEYGYPIRFPSIEVLTIGAGGGSLAYVDEAGSLRSGPQSAGSVPGPACYGRGGTEPTTSDANLVLGRLGSELVGGALRLDPVASEAVLAPLAGRFDMSVPAVARAIVDVANANMADAVRLVSIRRGYDPRDFTLVVFGGAGPVHGVALARELGIPTVLVPVNPGVTSALGCLMVDVRHDVAKMYFGQTEEVELEQVEAAFAELEDEARGLLALDGVEGGNMEFHRQIDMRYVGQWRSIQVPVERQLSSLDDAVAAFHEKHGREHNYRRDDAAVEIYRLHLTALGATPRPDLARHEGVGGAVPEPIETRAVVFDDVDAPAQTPVYWRDDLPAGMTFDGPAIVQQLDSTVVVEPGVRAEVDPWLNLRLSV